jgi:fructokinase
MEYDICSIGSALVDLTFKIDNEFKKKFEQRGIVKGGMTLIEKNDQNELVQELIQSGKIPDKACGGSATNSVVAASLFGSTCFMSCIVGDDENGKFYLEDLSQNGISHNSNLIDSEIPSGQCLGMVSDDAESKMCTNLGINSNISTSNVDEEVIKNSDYIFLEGYLVASPEGYDTFKEAITQAKKYNTKVALSLSDSFIVNSFKKELVELIEINCDLIFCNESEAQEFASSDIEKEIFSYFKDYTRNLIITKGSDGCIGYDDKTTHVIEANETTAVDSNGAGDMFAGAFMYAITHGHDFAAAGRLASAASSKVVSQFGPRLDAEQHEPLKTALS